MDSTLLDLKKQVLLILGEEVPETPTEPLGTASYPADFLLKGVHAALNAICSRVWKLAEFAVEDDAVSASLPDDHIKVQAVYEKERGLFLPRLQMQLFGPLGDPGGNAWHLFPSGTLSFVNKLPKGARVFYSAQWSKPDQDADVLEPPDATFTCLTLFAASYCLLRDASSSASIRQYNTKVDSGAPSDIPARVISDFLLGRFDRELQRLPMGEDVRTQ